MSRFSLTTSIVLVATSLPAATLSAEEGRPPQSPELRERVLKKFDKNGNAQLDPDERQAAKEAMEKRRGQAPASSGRGPASEKMREEMLKRFDRDGDGKLSDAERAAAKEERQKRRQE